MAKSNIKKEEVLRYLMAKINDSTQNVKFVMGLDGQPLYRPTIDDNGQFSGEIEEVDPETYQFGQRGVVPVSVEVSTGDFMNVKPIDNDENVKIESSTFSAVLGFLVYAENMGVLRQQIFALEEFRDTLLGALDILKTRQVDYTNDSNEEKEYTVATHCEDLDPESEFIINGVRYIQYQLQIDIDVSDGLIYGNQFQFSIAYSDLAWISSNQTIFNSRREDLKLEIDQTSLGQQEEPDTSLISIENIAIGTALKVTFIDGNNNTSLRYYIFDYQYSDYERLIPLQASLGGSQTLNGYQLIKNKGLTDEDIKRSMLVHSIVASRGWAITFTFLFDDSKNALVEMFKETYPFKKHMNKPYKVKLDYMKKTNNLGVTVFERYEPLSFEIEVISGETGTGLVHGDTTVFSIGFVPFWGKV